LGVGAAELQLTFISPEAATDEHFRAFGQGKHPVPEKSLRNFIGKAFPHGEAAPGGFTDERMGKGIPGYMIQVNRKRYAAVGYPDNLITLDGLQGPDKTVISQKSIPLLFQHTILDLFFAGTLKGSAPKNPPLCPDGEGTSHGNEGVEKSRCNQGYRKGSRQSFS
jgi:hypothetical protein